MNQPVEEAGEVRVLFFSLLKDIVREDELAVELSSLEVRTVDGLLRLLYDRFPDMRAWDDQILVAVDCEYATRNMQIQAGQKVAVMPPIQER